MDPISTSTYNLSAYPEDETTKISASTKSLSRFEEKNLKNLLPQFVATIISSSYHIMVGMGLAYSAVLIPQLEAKDSDIIVTKSQTSWIASVVPLIAPVASILAGYTMDRWGRLNTIKFSVIPGILGWLLIAIAWNVPMLITGRLISGLAAVLSNSPAVVYVTEIARKDVRGSFLSLGPAYVSLGIMIAYLEGWLMNWRTVAWVAHVYLIVPFFLMFILPESPLWLISKGRTEEARKALVWFHKNQPQPLGQNKTFAELQLDLLIKEDGQKKLEAQKGGGSTFKEFLKPTGYKPLLIIFGVFFFQQFSGIYIFMFYSVQFFEAAGTSVNPYFASIMIGVIRLVMSLFNSWMMKVCTRRRLILISASGMAMCTLISGLFTSWIKDGTTRLTWVPTLFLLLYVVFSMVGLLTIPWTMTAELFPLKIRSLAHSISTSVVNVFMFLGVQNYINLENLLGGSAGVQWFFSTISFIAVIFIFVFLPETHRKKLSEIEEYFQNNTIYLGQKKKKKNKEEAVDNNKNTTDCDKSEDDDKLINHV